MVRSPKQGESMHTHLKAGPPTTLSVADPDSRLSDAGALGAGDLGRDRNREARSKNLAETGESVSFFRELAIAPRELDRRSFPAGKCSGGQGGEARNA
jgi:hypothetical protein